MPHYWNDSLTGFLRRIELYARGGNDEDSDDPPPVRLRAWLKDSPIPTIEQTLAFARYMWTASSWYKHLSLFPPGVRFFFLLNPNAAMRSTRYNGYKLYWDASETAAKRTQFGIWDCLVDYDNLPGGVVQIEDPPEATSPDHPELGLYGMPIECFAHFTAFLRPTPVLLSVCQKRLKTQIPIYDQWALENPHHPDVARYRPFRRLADVLLHSANGGWSELKPFAEVEGEHQMQCMLDAMLAARLAWIRLLGAKDQESTCA